jgi:hypothetical protein
LLGVSVKLITGASALVAKHVASLVGMRTGRFVTGRDLATFNDEALWAVAEKTDLFVEVDPNQKADIILALKKKGHVVGFLGDGVNDAPAMPLNRAATDAAPKYRSFANPPGARRWVTEVPSPASFRSARAVTEESPIVVVIRAHVASNFAGWCEPCSPQHKRGVA